MIANNRGHLSDNQQRSSSSPWGKFVGTWQRPQRPVQLRIRTKFMAQQLLPQAQSPGGGEMTEGKSVEGNEEQLQVTSETVGTPPDSPVPEQLPVASEHSTPGATSEQPCHVPMSHSSQSTPPPPVLSSRSPSCSQASQRTQSASRVQSAPSHRCSSSSRSVSQACSAVSNKSATSTKYSQSSRVWSANSSVKQSRPQSRMRSDREASGIGSAPGSHTYTPAISTRGHSSHSSSSPSHQLRSSSSSTAIGQHRHVAVQCPTPTT